VVIGSLKMASYLDNGRLEEISTLPRSYRSAKRADL